MTNQSITITLNPEPADNSDMLEAQRTTVDRNEETGIQEMTVKAFRTNPSVNLEQPIQTNVNSQGITVKAFRTSSITVVSPLTNSTN